MTGSLTPLPCYIPLQGIAGALDKLKRIVAFAADKDALDKLYTTGESAGHLLIYVTQ
jgi:hypothetical protein